MPEPAVGIFDPVPVDIFAEPAETGVGDARGLRPTVADITIGENLSYRRTATNRELLHMLHIENAAKHLERLPDEGESIHAIMRGNFNGWDLVPAVLRLAAPATIEELLVCTLGFNKSNTVELLALLDAGRIGSVTFIASIYFEAKNKPEWDFLRTELRRRGQRCLAPRNHAKLLCMRLSDERHIVVESSANLRSCRNIEQFVMTHDRGLFEFHKAWISALVGAQETDRA